MLASKIISGGQPGADRGALNAADTCCGRPLRRSALSGVPDGTVVLRLRRPWSDGTRAIRFEPSEFLETPYKGSSENFEARSGGNGQHLILGVM